MANYKKPSSLLEQDKYTVEYTSGQLIMAICLLLLVALACFVLGMYVGPPTARTVAAPSAASAPAASAPSNQSTLREAGKVGQQTSPDPSVLSTVKGVSSTAPTTSPSPAAPTSAPVPPAAKAAPLPATGPTEKRSVELPPLDGPPQASGETVSKTDRAAPLLSMEKKELSPVVTEAPKGPASPPVDKAVPDTAKASSSSVAEVTALRASTSKRSKKAEHVSEAGSGDIVEPDLAPLEPVDTPSKGLFSIQVAAFSAASAAKADEYSKRIRRDTELVPEVVPSKDGQYVRVMVGSYPDRASAEQARQELKKKAEFRDCLVKARE